jgi:hypothetical protein
LESEHSKIEKGRKTEDSIQRQEIHQPSILVQISCKQGKKNQKEKIVFFCPVLRISSLPDMNLVSLEKAKRKAGELPEEKSQKVPGSRGFMEIIRKAPLPPVAKNIEGVQQGF